MPFAMTHLYIAYNILSNTQQIKKPCDFLLGAIAPDSVHFRENYNSDIKKKIKIWKKLILFMDIALI